MIVAVSCDRRPLGHKPVSHRVRPARAEVFVKECIIQQLRDAGMESVLLPPEGTPELVDWVLEHCDGVVITGGAFDIDPKWYGKEQQGRLDMVDEGRTQLEMTLAKKAIERDVPLLGLWWDAGSWVVQAALSFKISPHTTPMHLNMSSQQILPALGTPYI